MSTSFPRRPRPAVIYPDSDGQPMAENTLQFEWITTIKYGLDGVYQFDDDVFVAGDLLWYPVEGHPEIRTAPDIFVVFGRPKGYRGSYRQWEEGGIAPQVVFEILSPGNRPVEMQRKFEFYEKHGVEEYYVYDPEDGDSSGWIRDQNGRLCEIQNMRGHVSPLLNIRFDIADKDLVLTTESGERIVGYMDLLRQRDRAIQRADEEMHRALEEKRRAEDEKHRAEDEKRRADEQVQRNERQQSEIERLKAQLRALGQEPKL